MRRTGGLRSPLRAATAFYYVRDLDVALPFYTQVLGLTLKVRFGNSWAEVDAGSITIGLHATGDEDAVQQSGGATVSFTVEELDALVSELRKRGADVGEIRRPERGSFVIVRDPDGNSLHFIEFSRRWVEKTAYKRQQ